MMKFIAYLICYLVYPFSFLMPRSRRIAVYGSYRGGFNDNSKYLFFYANEHQKQLRSVWISTRKDTAQHVRDLGYEAYFVGAIKGLWLALRAHYWFVNDNTSDIIFCMAGGAKVINLWHGVPMKCIEFGITQGELAKRYIDKEFWEVFYHPASFRRPDLMVSTTDFFDEVFSKSFRITKTQCMQVGCPRNRMLTLPLNEVRRFVEKYESDYTRQLIDKMAQYDEVLVYMPTWRDSQRNCFANGFDLVAFNHCLKEKNALALMKPHANTILEGVSDYSNILFIDGNVDMYCILPFTDVLITDYSSVLYDYILMPDKKVILFHYDYEEYVREREFIFPIDQEIVGRRVYTFAEMCDVITHDDYEMNQQERQRIIDKFWGHTMDSGEDVCRNILNRVLD